MFASAAFDVEAESAGVVAPDFRFSGFGEQLSY